MKYYIHRSCKSSVPTLGQVFEVVETQEIPPLTCGKVAVPEKPKAFVFTFLEYKGANSDLNIIPELFPVLYNAYSGIKII